MLHQLEFVRTILMDLYNAHDCLLHDLIVDKLEVYGLAKERLQSLSDYLSCRKQRTKIDSRGFYFGVLFFNIFSDDIFLVLGKSSICNFADDNTLFSHGSNIPLILNNIEHDMTNLLYWFKINSLKANLRKFQLMIIGKKIV